MNIDAGIDLGDLHATIVAAIAAEFPALATVEFYREDRTELPVPACLLNLEEFEHEPDSDPGTEQISVALRFEAEFIMGFRDPNVKVEIRRLVGAFAAFLHRARWPGGHISPAMAIHAYRSDFKPQLDQYEVWVVEWRQIANLGASVWTGGGITPTTIYLAQSPDIGTGNEDKYTQVSP